MISFLVISAGEKKTTLHDTDTRTKLKIMMPMHCFSHFFFCSLQNNIGHRLLVKQGWQAGQGLGKQLQGILPTSNSNLSSFYVMETHAAVFTFARQSEL